MPDEQLIIATVKIEQIILLIRGENVMLDSDLAALYGVTTKALIQAVKRNLSRFPEDFMFQLTAEEFANLRSQFVTSSSRQKAGVVGDTRHTFSLNRAWQCFPVC